MIQWLIVSEENATKKFTFLFKVSGDDSPARLLPDLIGDLLRLVPLLHVVILWFVHLDSTNII